MTRLLDVELRRLLSRRLFRLLMLGVLATILILNIVLGVRSNRNFAAAEARAAALAEQYATPPPGMLAHCGGKVNQVPVAPPAGDAGGPVAVGPCAFRPPTAAELYSDPRFSFAGNAVHELNTAVDLVAVVGFIVGAGFIGAEWAAGTFPLLLTWRPRRLRVLAAKALATIGVFVVAGAAAIVLAMGCAWLIATTRGTTGGTNTHVWHILFSDGLRGLVLVALLTGAGLAIAGLTRHTSSVLAGAIGYLVVFEVVMRRFHPEWQRWFLLNNAGALLNGWVHIELPPRLLIPGQGPSLFTLHADRAALYLGALFVGAMAAWAIALVRRDVDEAGR
jgi:hypothetical protein